MFSLLMLECTIISEVHFKLSSPSWLKNKACKKNMKCPLQKFILGLHYTVLYMFCLPSFFNLHKTWYKKKTEVLPRDGSISNIITPPGQSFVAFEFISP